jgi:hypothetical protein
MRIIYIFIFAMSIFRSSNVHADNFDSTEKIYEVIDNIKVYNIVDKVPDCIIDGELWLSFISRNLEVPQLDSTCWYSKIIFSFLVLPDGTISKSELIFKYYQCSDSTKLELYRTQQKLILDNIMKNLPIWSPAIYKGEKVAFKVLVPINIEIKF